MNIVDYYYEALRDWAKAFEPELGARLVLLEAEHKRSGASRSDLHAKAAVIAREAFPNADLEHITVRYSQKVKELRT